LAGIRGNYFLRANQNYQKTINNRKEPDLKIRRRVMERDLGSIINRDVNQWIKYKKI